MIFTERPVDFSPIAVTVTCAVVSPEGLLVLQRHPDKPHGGLWCLPGGKAQQAEALNVAAARELREETGILVDPAALTGPRTWYLHYPEGDYVYRQYPVKLYMQPHVKLEDGAHVDYRWIRRDQLEELPLIMYLEDVLVDIEF